ncbi:MAG TPA: hypothetical protein VGK67_12270 [Myxococcales bacterium]|jgi:hypothetical protein
MAQVRILFLALAALSLAGCGKAVCDKVADGYYAYRSAALGCAYVVPSVKIGDACGVNSAQCDGNDTTLLENYGTCLGEIAKCETGKEQAFADAETACFKGLAGLSDGCYAGLSMICTTSTNQVSSLLDAWDMADSRAGNCTTPPPAVARPFKEWEDCLRGIGTCSHADVTKLEAYTLCLSSLDKCEDGKEAEFTAAEDACLTALSLSTACAEALKVPAAAP